MRQKSLFIIVFLLLCLSKGFSQQSPAIVDSLYRVYQSEKNLKLKASLAGRLAWLYLTLQPVRSDSFGKLAIEHAELSRERGAIAKAYRNTAERYAHLASIKENIAKAFEYYNKAYNVARENKLDKEMVTILLGMASLSRSIPDAEKAMNYTSQAMAAIPNTHTDSLQARCYISFGDNYLLKQEKLLALKNFFNALKFAEVKKDPQLLRDCYLNLSGFYYSVKNYDKSLDYLVKASEKLADIKDANARYLKVGDLNSRGNLFAAKDQFELARKSFDEAIAVADQLKYEPLKLTGYVSIFSMYLAAKQPAEALKYLNETPAIKAYFSSNGLDGIVEQLYGYVYTDMNLLDSAGYYYKKSLPFFSRLGNSSKIQFYNNYARYEFKAKNYNDAIVLLQEAGATAKQINDLEAQAEINKQLDSAYQLKGDYKSALAYSTAARLIKDSLEVLGKEADILQLQLADEDERQARLAKEEEESKKRRHQVQYYGITIGIGVLFVMLVMLGTFRVSARTIRIIGFFTFLMLFEFIFLLLKKNFYTITHGEPWKDLGVMIGLAALLLPLHHAVEHKVIHYLTHKQLITLKTNKYLSNFLRKKEKAQAAEEVI